MTQGVEDVAPSGVHPVRRLLCVEDDPVSAAFVRGLVETVGGWDLTVVGTTRDAMHVLREDPVEAVLLDLGLPDAHGVEGLARVLTIAAAPPVVVLTGAEEANLGDTALRMGAEDFLPKAQLAERGAAALLDRCLRYAMARHRQRQLLQQESARLRWLSARQQQLIQSLSRDLQRPVTAIYGLATTVAERSANLKAAERRVLMDKLTSNAAALSTKLLTLIADTQPEQASEPRQRIPLADVIPAAINAVAERPEGTKIAVEGELPHVWARPEALQAAVSALVTNALRHGEPGRPPAIVVSVRPFGRGVRITVADDGMPIPSPFRQAIFEPGVKLDDGSPGAGLGLTMVRAVAADHGGAAWAEESEQGGTAVTITIPDLPPEPDEEDGVDASVP